MEIKVHYYSERGLINNLIDWIRKASEEDLIRFLKLFDERIETVNNIDIYNEFSFSQFGNPDLIIKVDYKVFLIEAKIDTFVNSATKEDTRYVFKDNASKINIQLLLRKRFINTMLKTESSVIKEAGPDDNDKDNYVYGRAFKKKSLYKFIKEINDINNEYYYVALVNKDDISKEEIYKKYFEDNKYDFKESDFIYISWNDIFKVVGNELDETCEYTGMNK